MGAGCRAVVTYIHIAPVFHLYQSQCSSGMHDSAPRLQDTSLKHGTNDAPSVCLGALRESVPDRGTAFAERNKRLQRGWVGGLASAGSRCLSRVLGPKTSLEMRGTGAHGATAWGRGAASWGHWAKRNERRNTAAMRDRAAGDENGAPIAADAIGLRHPRVLGFHCQWEIVRLRVDTSGDRVPVPERRRLHPTCSCGWRGAPRALRVCWCLALRGHYGSAGSVPNAAVARGSGRGFPRKEGWAVD